MEAQQIITMSINKITGSRGQRGGVNLRKNLLVASVLHSARAMYYEEMCNRMSRTAELHSMEKESIEDEEDCTEAPDWGDDECDSAPTTQEPSSCQRTDSCAEENATQRPTEDKENCQPAAAEISPVQARLEEKPEPASSSTMEQSPDSACSPSPDKERVVLGQKNTNSPQSKSGCSACKRKRSDSSEELREACESILPKRPKTDSESQAEKPNSEQGSITSLVTIFKSGFHGLSGESNPQTNLVSSSSSGNNHLQQSSYASSMPRPFEQLQMPIAAC